MYFILKDLFFIWVDCSLILDHVRNETLQNACFQILKYLRYLNESFQMDKSTFLGSFNNNDDDDEAEDDAW